MPLYALPEVRPGWWGNMQRLTFTLACPNIPWTSQQTVSDTFGKLPTTVHMNQLLFVTKGLGDIVSHAGRSQVLPTPLAPSRKPFRDGFATCRAWNPQTAETRDVTTKILEFANTSTGWPSWPQKQKDDTLSSPVSHRHRCFGRRKGDFQKISLKEQAKINQKKHGMPIRHLRI